MFRYIIMLLTSVCLVSCLKNRHAAVTPKIGYVYILQDTIIDSVMVYKNLPFERSLELYKDTDSITKFASPEYMPSVYLSVFQVEKQKFAVIADSVTTTFYKFSPSRGYRRLCSVEAPVGIKITLQRKDLNNDGYKDVFYTIDSGGIYGDDSVILFFDPESKSLACNSVGLLRNAEVKGGRVEMGGSFWGKTYVIKGNELLLIEERIDIWEPGLINKEAVTTYDENGKVISIDTLTIKERPGW